MTHIAATVTEPHPRADSRIIVRGVHKNFGSGRDTFTALHDVDLEIQEGSFTTLFGPSGCGKTTLLRILAGLQTQDSGEISLFGQTPRAATREKNIAWIPQSSALLPWREVRANALLSKVVNRRADRRASPKRVDQEVETVLNEMGLRDFARSRPSQLSGGMRQRASLARGFVHGAPVMLMDEPFSALDEFTREALRYQLLDMWQLLRKTVVFVTHSASEAVLLSDRVVVMTSRPGRIHRIIDVDLPRPRHARLERSIEFHEKVTEVRNALQEGWS
ncbi:NitT/TauT family transport system ATP-binding protein [Rhodococcus sp. SMB37]|uniref:ABC transporter ATP-binding protein n=1 Tax=Rhodococcus sp. SMB37 TaxID=2512213 RepID=UPI0010515856|nr:ABC transporter ATP-binding protein [Rhodococcus sp. SMB37]TCN55870.1 NitT/TauT family transport system ATP-binding protein [Rhodococcus sp. SMB37]